MTPEPPANVSSRKAAIDPVTHLVLLPILLFNLGTSVSLAIRAHGHHRVAHAVAVLVALALILLNTKTRTYALRVQDRVIRLEERLRISALVSVEAAYALSTSQLIGLRFASDAELPALVRRTLDERLTRKQIKDSIQSWRPDPERI